MKNNFRLFLLLCCFCCVVIPATTGCRKNMDELNVNPNAPASVNPDYLFTYSVVKGMGSYITNANVHYWLLMNWNMYFATLGGVEAGKEYDSNDGKDALWNEMYSQALINAREVQRLTEGNSWLVNKNAIARIWQVYLFAQITDLFGDIPYTDALNGAVNLNFTPVYDRQSVIYPLLADELKRAAELLDPAKALFPGNSDPVYKGDIGKWKSFAHSLRLRLAVRIQSVNPVFAAQEIAELQNTTLFSSNNDNASFPYNGEIRNPLFDLIQSGQGGGRTYPSKFLIDKLKSLNDPRIRVFAQYTTESLIIGIPDYEGVPNLVPSGASIWNNYNSDASDVSRIGTWFIKQDVPGLLMSYAEVCFLKAEIALQNGGNAQQLYEDGVRASIESYTGSGITIPEINTFIGSLPPVNLEQIITQKWLSYVFRNGFEPYAEYRRTGFPLLCDYNAIPVNPLIFPNRLTYPATETTLNSLHYNQAIAQQGPDLASTKIWWDQP